MMGPLKHKGYRGFALMDTEAKVFRGEVVGIVDVVTFQGRSYDELEGAFVDSVEDYLEFCASLGKAPNKPFSGKLTLRVSPEVHEALSVRAKAEGKSLNTLTSQVLGSYAQGQTLAEGRGRAAAPRRKVESGKSAAKADAGEGSETVAKDVSGKDARSVKKGRVKAGR